MSIFEESDHGPETEAPPMQQVGRKLLGYRVNAVGKVFPSAEAAKQAAAILVPEPIYWKEDASESDRADGFERWAGVNISRLSQKSDDSSTIRIHVTPEWEPVMACIEGARWIDGMPGHYICPAPWGWKVGSESNVLMHMGRTEAEVMEKAWKAYRSREKALEEARNFRPPGLVERVLTGALGLFLVGTVLALGIHLLEAFPALVIGGVAAAFILYVVIAKRS